MRESDPDSPIQMVTEISRGQKKAPKTLAGLSRMAKSREPRPVAPGLQQANRPTLESGGVVGPILEPGATATPSS